MSITILRYRADDVVASLSLPAPFDGDVLLVRDEIPLLDADVQALHAALYSAEMYAAASPRIHNGSVLALPYLSEQSMPLSQKAAQSLQNTAANYLHEFQRVPQPACECVLLKRSVIEQCGFLSRECATIQGAIWEFCFRVNRVGFSIVAANRVFLYKLPQLPCPRALYDRDMELLHAKYSESFQRIAQYQSEEMDAADFFLERIDPLLSTPKQILLDCITFASNWPELDALLAILRASAHVDLLITVQQEQRYGFSRRYEHLVHPDTLTKKYDLGYLLGGFCSEEQYRRMNEHCLRIACDLPNLVASSALSFPMRLEQARLLLQTADGCFCSPENAEVYRAAFLHEPHLLERLSAIIEPRENSCENPPLGEALARLLNSPLDLPRLQERFSVFRLLGRKSEWSSPLPPPPRSLLARFKRRFACRYPKVVAAVKRMRNVRIMEKLHG